MTLASEADARRGVAKALAAREECAGLCTMMCVCVCACVCTCVHVRNLVL